jgi:hypothetical protein
MPVFDAGSYDVNALFRAAARGEIETPGAIECTTEDQRRQAAEWLCSRGYQEWLRGK